LERTRKSREGGFSLLEIFIALLILSIGVFGLAMLELTAVTARIPLASAKVRTATGLAQATLDRFQEIPWRDLRSSHPDGFQRGPEGVSPAFSRLSASSGDSVVVQGTTYYRIWQVTPDPGIPSLKTISVWSCWRQGDGPWRQVVLVTQRADAGN
jgi:hypothetical protein